MINVVIADDQVLFAETLKMVLESRSREVKVVGIAHTGGEAVRSVEALRPDIVLMDVRMPEMDGVYATKLIHARFPDVRIIILTTYDDDEYILDALGYGAVGYILKNIPPDKLIDCITAVKNGNVLIAPEIAKKLVDHAANAKNESGDRKSENIDVHVWYELLSRREREILRHLAKGLDNKQIAETLFLADQTVKNHISVIYSKLGVHDRVKLAMLAQEMQGKKP
jgi:DNA-binding NarL/FixJ family response regulator